MTEQQSDDQQQPAETKVKIDCSRPGELLKKAREAKGLTQVEVAKKLNFLPIYVPALENEEFEPLHSVTFVKGYLRAYARFLGIDADEVLHCFAMHHPELATQETHNAVEVLKPEKNTSSLAFKLISLLVIVALIAIIIMWWQSRSLESLPSVSNQDVQVDTLDGNTIIAPIEVEEIEIMAVDEDAAQKKTTDEVTKEEKLPEPVVEPEQPKPVAAAKPKPQPKEEPATNSHLVAVTAAKTITGDPAAATLGNGKLVALSFSDECWVEVRDNAGDLLHASLMQADDKILLEGQPPFRMVFGYGQAAKVFYRGEAFDFSSRIRANGYASIQVE